jgi:C4-dicarboxylate-binding protein DctP
MKKTSIVLLSLLVGLVILGGSLDTKHVFAEQEKSYAMRIGYAGKGDVQDIAANIFKQNLSSIIGDRIKVEVYPGGQLGSNEIMLQKLQRGTIQGVYNPPAFLGGRHDLLTILDLPYFLNTDDVGAARILNGQIGRQLTKGLEKYNMMNLRFYPAGERILLTNFGVENIDSFKGKKIRVMLSPVMINTYNAWGASGVPLNVPELYTALQQGTVDGADITVMFAYRLKFHEVTKYLIMIPRIPLNVMFLTNKTWFESLPNDLQAAIEKAVKNDKEAIEKGGKLTSDYTGRMLNEGQKQIFPSPNLIEVLKRQSKQVHTKFLEDYPQAKPIYEEIIKAQ